MNTAKEVNTAICFIENESTTRWTLRKFIPPAKVPTEASCNLFIIIADTTTIMLYGLPKGPPGRKPLRKDTRKFPHEEPKDIPKGGI